MNQVRYPKIIYKKLNPIEIIKQSTIITYIQAYIIENSYTEIHHVNNTIEPLEKFDKKVKKREKE